MNGPMIRSMIYPMTLIVERIPLKDNEPEFRDVDPQLRLEAVCGQEDGLNLM